MRNIEQKEPLKVLLEFSVGRVSVCDFIDRNN